MNAIAQKCQILFLEGRYPPGFLWFPALTHDSVIKLHVPQALQSSVCLQTLWLLTQNRKVILFWALWFIHISTNEPVGFQEVFGIETCSNPAANQLRQASWPKFAKLCKRWSQIKWLDITVSSLGTFKFSNVTHTFDNIFVLFTYQIIKYT